jgi:hypothetical protein
MSERQLWRTGVRSCGRGMMRVDKVACVELEVENDQVSRIGIVVLR